MNIKSLLAASCVFGFSLVSAADHKATDYVAETLQKEFVGAATSEIEMMSSVATSLIKFYGIDVNKATKDGISLIHVMACTCPQEEALKVFLALPGLNLDAKTDKGHTALDLAKLAGNKRAEKLLQEALAKTKK